MKIVGILTENPRRYYEMLSALRDEGLKHISLDFSEPLPANVEVVISTEAERGRIPFDMVVTDDEPESAIIRVKSILAGEDKAEDLTIGIDPGDRPGIAILSHGTVLNRTLAPAPEAVGEIVQETMKRYAPTRVTIRLGNGDRTNRNRIFNALWDLGYVGEMVDERNTTRRSKTPDEDAAVEIAQTPGYQPRKRQQVAPAPGEIRNVQRLSRMHTMGELTVSKRLAKMVASGEISMDEAVEMQRGSRRSNR